MSEIDHRIYSPELAEVMARQEALGRAASELARSLDSGLSEQGLRDEIDAETLKVGQKYLAGLSATLDYYEQKLGKKFEENFDSKDMLIAFAKLHGYTTYLAALVWNRLAHPPYWLITEEATVSEVTYANVYLPTFRITQELVQKHEDTRGFGTLSAQFVRDYIAYRDGIERSTKQ